MRRTQVATFWNADNCVWTLSVTPDPENALTLTVTEFLILQALGEQAGRGEEPQVSLGTECEQKARQPSLS